ncbi:MAG: RecQ family ATP-dependent DNA helicase [Pseudomonadales bacterium]
MDVFYTGNYVRSHNNFRISGLPDGHTFDSRPIPVLNILMRGTPTQPSQFLKSALLELDVPHPGSTSVQIDLEHHVDWKLTILGNEDGFNPASVFFHEILPEALGELKFVTSLIRPECEISDIVDSIDSKRFKHQRVDFYLAAARLVIEIDGSQHEQNIGVATDRERDRFLYSNGVKTIRIPVWAATCNIKIKPYVLEILSILEEAPIVRRAHYGSVSNDDIYGLIYITIFRFQVIVLELIRLGKISLDDEIWKIEVISDIEIDFLHVAIKDLSNWFSILDSNICFPSLHIVDSDGDVKIVLRVKTRWDDRISEGVVCETDHLEYFTSETDRRLSKDYYSFIRYAESKVVWGERLSLKGLLYETFGYEEFNLGQIDIINNVTLGRDTIGLLPTGGGKSLCYQLPSIVGAGLCLVVCPIKSLMRDQVNELASIGYHRSASIDSDTPASLKEKILRDVTKGRIRFLFVSPERLQNAEFRSRVEGLSDKNLISLVVVDEVHCMSEWGHDFRTAYLTLANTIRSVCRNVPVLCLTATASQRVLKDIQEEFEISDHNVQTLSRYERPNLRFSVIECDPFGYIGPLVSKLVAEREITNEKATIVFTSFVDGRGGRGAATVKKGLESIVPTVEMFTGGPPKSFSGGSYEAYKASVQSRFKNSKFPLLVATKAFGMGVNKRDISTTIHVGLPSSLEALYQEAGRAGRDGRKSNCITLYGRSDLESARRFFGNLNMKQFANISLSDSAGDLSGHHYFIKSSIKDNQSIPPLVRRIIFELLGVKGEKAVLTSSHLKSSKRDVELALYRLYQMGVVEDWVIVDFYKGIFDVKFGLYQIKHHNDKVERFTNGSGLTARQLGDVVTAEDYSNAIVWLANIVIDHHINTRIRNRVESLRTLVDACDEYGEDSCEAFRQKIESYFSNDQSTKSLSYIVEDNGSFDSILGYLRGSPSGESALLEPKSDLDSRRFSIRRFIESYPDQLGLTLTEALIVFHSQGDNSGGKLIDRVAAFIAVTDSDIEAVVNFLSELRNLSNLDKWAMIEEDLINTVLGERGLPIYMESTRSDIATTLYLERVNSEFGNLIGDRDERI